MFGDLFESLIPHSEFDPNQSIVSYRLWLVGQALQTVESSISEGMLGRIEAISNHSDAILDPTYVSYAPMRIAPTETELRNEEIARRMALGNDLGFNPGAPEDTAQIIAKNNELARVISMEEYREKTRSVEERAGQSANAESARKTIEAITLPGYEALPSEPTPTIISTETADTQVARTVDQLDMASRARDLIKNIPAA